MPCDIILARINSEEGKQMIGLRRGDVSLFEHQKEWETEGERTVKELSGILGNDARDIQHVGSTSIKSIKAKPIIDIAVGTDDFERILAHEDELLYAGYHYRPQHDMNGTQLLFACGSYYEGGDMQTHFIHVVKYNSMEWRNYINFRDYLNAFPEIAKQYENVKIGLVEKLGNIGSRNDYVEGKAEFISHTLRKATAWSFLGKTVTMKTDRPLGYVHRKSRYELVYPLNYGYIPGVLGGDGEELDVYLVGVNEPVDSFTGRIIGVAHRADDVEDKLIMAPLGVNITLGEAERAIHFQEQYYDTHIELIEE